MGNDLVFVLSCGRLFVAMGVARGMVLLLLRLLSPPACFAVAQCALDWLGSRVY